MKEINDNSRTWSGTHNMKDFEISPGTREEKQDKNQIHSKRIKSCLTYLLVAAVTAISLILFFIILDRNGRNPVLVYFQNIIPSKAGESELFKSDFQKVTNGHSFMEKDLNSRYLNSSENGDEFGLKSDSGHYKSVLELYMNRLFVTPLNKMSLTIPVNDQILRSYQVEAIDYSINDEMILYLSLGHQLKINNETMVLYDKSMNIINYFPTYGDEQGSEKGFNQSLNNQNNSTDNKLRNSENKRRLQQLKQHEYYNYTSTSEWNHKPEIVNNIIPTYYPRNPYVPPYGNPYYFAPNILVPYVYIY